MFCGWRAACGRRVGWWGSNSYNAAGLFTWGATVVPGKIEGAVVAYGPTGNLVTDIPHDRLQGVPAGDGVKISCDEHETVGSFAADQQVLGIGAARDGGVWIATTGKIRKRIGDEWADEISPLPWRST